MASYLVEVDICRILVWNLIGFAQWCHSSICMCGFETDHQHLNSIVVPSQWSHRHRLAIEWELLQQEFSTVVLGCRQMFSMHPIVQHRCRCQCFGNHANWHLRLKSLHYVHRPTFAGIVVLKLFESISNFEFFPANGENTRKFTRVYNIESTPTSRVG